MKTRQSLLITVILAVVAAVIVLIGCGSKPAVSKVDELDTAIRDASNYLNDNIPNGSKIVILNIQSSSPELSDYIIDELIANAVNDKVFSVVDRQQLDALRSEQNFQLSGEVDDTAALEIGKFFGAQTIVSGGVNKLGNGHRIRIRALEVQTAQVQGQYNRNIATSPIIADLMGSSGSSTPAAAQKPAAVATATADGLTITGLSAYKDNYVIGLSSNPVLVAREGSSNGNWTARKINGDSVTVNVWQSVEKYKGSHKKVGFIIFILNSAQVSGGNLNASTVASSGLLEVDFTNGRGIVNFTVGSAQAAAPAQTAAPPAQAYKIGDTGPAGGIIFYDKGNNSGGWRYLEAAPEETEFQAKWSVHGTRVEGTRPEIGSGKRNTQLVVDKFKQTSGEWDTVVQKCDELVFGKFDDWFLPSKDELDQMYGNLKRKNLGGFKNDRYWSSSYGSYGAWSQRFSDGWQNSGDSFGYQELVLFVRAIRQF